MAEEKTDTIRWDVQFFFKTPTDFPLISADDLRVAPITKSGWARIVDLQEKLTSVKRFLEDKERQYFFLTSIRVEATTAHKAIFKAHTRLEAYIDSLAVAGFCVPAVVPIAVVREGTQPQADIMEFHRDRWLEGTPNTTTERDSWTNRSDEIMRHLLPVLSQLMEKAADDHNELAWRALYSAKLFRRGIESRSFGVEFFCKFAALENLVAGGEISNKGEKLKHRLVALVGDLLPGAATQISELWKRRHPVVHEARLEFIDEDPQAFPVHIHMDTLNWLFQVTFVFLSDHFGSVSSLAELWKQAEGYRIPHQIRGMRPKEIARFAASTWSEKCGLVWNGVGKLIDELWAAPSVEETRGA